MGHCKPKSFTSPSPRRKRVAACQILTGSDIAANTAKILHYLAECVRQELDIVVFPEGALFGYTCAEECWLERDPAELIKAEQKIASFLANHSLAAVIGSAHREQGQWRNSLAVFDCGGRPGPRYSKMHLAGEAWCQPNSGRLPLVSLSGVKSCFLICHDIRYPELVRLPAAKGAEICLFASNESTLLREDKLSAYRAMPIARAAENGLFLVMANAPANPQDVSATNSSHGNSKVIHPDGNVLKEANYFSEEIVAVDIDLTAADQGFARRAVRDANALSDWMRQGLVLVDDRSRQG